MDGVLQIASALAFRDPFWGRIFADHCNGRNDVCSTHDGGFNGFEMMMTGENGSSGFENQGESVVAVSF